MDRAEEIARAGTSIGAVLDEKHRARELTLRASRSTIQCSAASIRATQRGEFDLAESLAGDAAAHLRQADEAVSAHLDVRHGGYLHDAKKEYAEARITLAFVRGDALPMPDELGIEAAAYLNGLAEAASELRRHILDCLRGDRRPAPDDRRAAGRHRADPGRPHQRDRRGAAAPGDRRCGVPAAVVESAVPTKRTRGRG
jgi:translin